jgi:hypothetical protein
MAAHLPCALAEARAQRADPSGILGEVTDWSLVDSATVTGRDALCEEVPGIGASSAVAVYDALRRRHAWGSTPAPSTPTCGAPGTPPLPARRGRHARGGSRAEVPRHLVPGVATSRTPPVNRAASVTSGTLRRRHACRTAPAGSHRERALSALSVVMLELAPRLEPSARVATPHQPRPASGRGVSGQRLPEVRWIEPCPPGEEPSGNEERGQSRQKFLKRSGVRWV